MGKNLTEKQLRFVSEYLIDGNAARAARAAGYNPKTAHSTGGQNLKKRAIAQRIAEERQKHAERCEITADSLMRDLEQIKSDCMAKARDADGAEAMRNAQAAIRAIELQGKRIGAWIDKTEHSGELRVTWQSD